MPTRTVHEQILDIANQAARTKARQIAELEGLDRLRETAEDSESDQIVVDAINAHLTQVSGGEHVA